MTPRFIIVSGLIGAGKTTFTTQLAEHLGYEANFEPVDTNPYLGDFYENPQEWAYVMQEHLKSLRFRQHMSAVWGIQGGRIPGVVMDRSIWEDTVFAEINRDIGNIEDRKFHTYLLGFSDMVRFLAEPDVVIFLDAKPETCRDRILERDRPEERGKGLNTDADEGVPMDYLKRLYDGYQRWLDTIANRMTVIQVPWDNFRPVDVVWSGVLEKIEERSRYTRSIVLP